MWFDVRYGTKFLYVVYMPQLFYLVVSYMLSPVWRRTDERYHLRFAEGEGDDIDETEPFVTYQQRKKPITRRKYSDSVKLVYSGEEEYDYVPEQPLRYRWTRLLFCGYSLISLAFVCLPILSLNLHTPSQTGYDCVRSKRR